MKTIEQLQKEVDEASSAHSKAVAALGEAKMPHLKKLRAELKSLLKFRTYILGDYKLSIRVDEGDEFVVKSVTGPDNLVCQIIKESLDRSQVYDLERVKCYKQLYDELVKCSERSSDIADEIYNCGETP